MHLGKRGSPTPSRELRPKSAKTIPDAFVEASLSAERAALVRVGVGPGGVYGTPVAFQGASGFALDRSRSLALPAEASALEGQWVVAEASVGAAPARVVEPLGLPASAKASLLGAAIGHGMKLGYPAAVLREVEAFRANPGIAGPDFRSIPFVTIDGPSSTDLDQAMYLERRGDGGIDVYYAIADAAHFLKPGSALDREARARAATTYLPTCSLPMMPRELSSDLCSLREGVDRRAFIVHMSLDNRGEVVSTQIDRGVIRSRKKLCFHEVQEFHDAGQRGALGGQPWSESLELLAEFGRLRMARAAERGCAAFEGGDARVSIDPETDRVTVERPSRLEVEKWNEQVSLLANQEVGRFLRERNVPALYRVHPPPDRRALESFRAKVAELGRPWRAGVPLQTYLAGLPDDDKGQVIRRLAVRVQSGATYSTEPSGHHALGLDSYLHFTAPMRRYADVQEQRALAAALEGRRSPLADASEVESVLSAITAAKKVGKAIAQEAKMRVAALALRERVGTVVRGRIMGVQRGSLEVDLEDPALSLRVPYQALDPDGYAERWLARAGTELHVDQACYRLGEGIQLQVRSVDPSVGKVEFRVPGVD